MDRTMGDRTRRQLPLVIMLAITFLTAFGLSLVFPVLPSLVGRATGDPGQVALWVGVLTSVYAGCALFAGPILGTLSDRIGRKPILVVCLAGSAVGWVIFGIGGSLVALLVARIVDGVTAGEQSVAFAYMADITSPGDRAKRFGLLGAVSGMAFLIGPALGGVLAGIDVAAPAYAAAAASALTAILALTVLPESLPPEKRNADARFDANPFGSLLETARRPGLGRRMVVFALIVGTLTVVSSNFAVLSFDVLAWQPIQIGWLLTGVGVVDIVVQGGLLGLLVRVAGERRVVIGGLLGLAVSFAMLVAIAAFAPSAVLMVVAALLFASSEGSTTATLQATLSEAVAEDEQGGLAGGLSAIVSAAGLVLPVLTGLLYTEIAPAAPYALSIVAIIAALVIMLRLGDKPVPIPGVAAVAD
jgi:MFS transporter, DHA1 family, tetracycline resistance protein